MCLDCGYRACMMEVWGSRGWVGGALSAVLLKHFTNFLNLRRHVAGLFYSSCLRCCSLVLACCTGMSVRWVVVSRRI